MATKEARGKSIAKIKNAIASGLTPVVTVSAMGRKGEAYATDTLLGLLKNSKETFGGNVDLLLSCGEVIAAVVLADELAQEGLEAVVLNGYQAGIITDNHYTEASIIDLRPQKILDFLEAGKLVVVTGFQGATEDGDPTTLGRGGSDTTAAALGVALEAKAVEIYTDVEGVMTADPRIVPKAKILETITYNELCHLAYQGAKVVHPRAVEMVMMKQIPMRVRSTFSDKQGTLVVGEKGGKDMEERLITGIAYLDDLTQIKLKTDGAHHGETLLMKAFQALAEGGISIDFINIYPECAVFTIKNDQRAKAEKILRELPVVWQIRSDCAKVSVVGANITGVPGVMAKIMAALVEENIELLQTADSYTTIWCLVKDSDKEKAVRALHQKFNLS